MFIHHLPLPGFGAMCAFRQLGGATLLSGPHFIDREVEPESVCARCLIGGKPYLAMGQALVEFASAVNGQDAHEAHKPWLRRDTNVINPGAQRFPEPVFPGKPAEIGVCAAFSGLRCATFLGR